MGDAAKMLQVGQSSENQRLAWSSPPPDVLLGDAQLQAHGVGNDSTEANTAAGKMPTSVAQFFNIPSIGKQGEESRAHIFDDRYEEALAEMQRLADQLDLLVKDVPDASTHQTSSGVFGKSSMSDFARLLLDSVQRRCFSHNTVKAGISCEAFADAGAQIKDFSKSAIQWSETNIESNRQGAAECLDIVHDAECRVVVENLFFDSMPRQHVLIHSIDNVVQPLQARRFLQRVKDENATVGVTFYGAQPEHAGGILQNGTVPQEWGSFVGTHAGVAHLNADVDQQGRRYLCVLLTVVGARAAEEWQPQLGRMQPHQGEASALDRLASQANIGPVDEDLILVTHLITYSVNCGGRKRVGGGFDDPFLRKLSSAIQRAGGTGTAAVRSSRSGSGNSRPRRGRQQAASVLFQ
jgi:hypothetical protein